MVAHHKLGVRFLFGVALIAGATLVATGAHAATKTGAQAGKKTGAAASKQTSSPYAQQIAALHATVVLLEQADHDYQGHRVNAIKDIRAAIHALKQGTAAHAGVKKTGKTGGNKVVGGNETQAVSDGQLQQALVSLAAIQGQLAGGKGPGAAKAVTSIQAAIAELQTALKIK